MGGVRLQEVSISGGLTVVCCVKAALVRELLITEEIILGLLYLAGSVTGVKINFVTKLCK